MADISSSRDSRRRVASLERWPDRPGVELLDEGRIIVARSPEGSVRACVNRCRHQGGRFRLSGGELVCSNHGWRLDPQSMTYINPAGSLRQPELVMEPRADGGCDLYAAQPERPWGEVRAERGELSPAELVIRFYAHACIEIRCGGRSLFTDPWLLGPAFSRGWWLAHVPPDDWLERIVAASAIFISHNHSDHLNLPTLRCIARRRSDIPVMVPAFESGLCRALLARTGLSHVRSVPFDEWVPWGDDGRFMVLHDGSGRDDSGILFEYRGHRILDTVDCENINDGELPEVDVLLSSFAGGATGYPVCWRDLYSEERIAAVVAKNLKHYAAHAAAMVKETGARVYVPFAGYFVEAHPADAEIRHLNVKNTPQEVRELVHARAPDAAVWIPEPGAHLDLASLAVVPPQTPPRVPDHDFRAYTDAIAADLDFPPLATSVGVLRYFQWAGFRGDLVLHILETDEAFAVVLREIMVDFATLSVVDQRPSSPHRYLRMRVRADVLRHVMRNGLPWEEISIGFQARFYREPDAYNFDFWNHFQNKLPLTPPRFDDG